MQQRFKILRLLSDGRFHSGRELGETLGISRSAIWKHLLALNELDIDIHAVRGRGYCSPENASSQVLMTSLKIRCPHWIFSTKSIRRTVT